MKGWELLKLSDRLDDWTAARMVVRSEDCPGGVAIIVGGAEEYARLIAATPMAYDLIVRAFRGRIDDEWLRDAAEYMRFK